MSRIREDSSNDPAPPESGGVEGPFRAPTSRRGFLKGMSFAAGAALLTKPALGQESQPAAPEEIPGLKVLGRGPQSVTLKINGKDHKLSVEPRTTLLDAVREQAGLTGCKEVCDRGTCGACTMLVDGKAVCSCLALAVDLQDHEVTTIEGIANDPKHKALIDAYCEHDAAQCGFCIPGFVVRSAAYLEETPGVPSREEIAQGLSGNICRCGTYVMVLNAVEAAAKAKGGQQA